MIYAFATVNAILAAGLFIYGLWDDHTHKIKAASKHDCMAEIVKSINMVGDVKSACDKLNAPPHPIASPYGCRYNGCY